MSSELQFTIVNIGCLSMNKYWGETERVRSGTATCTVLRAGETTMLVDPSPYPDRLEPMLFDRTGLRPAEIDMVFVTHYHGDHRYSLELFEGKPWLMASAALIDWRERSPDDAAQFDRFVAAEGRLPEGIRLLHTPGHLPGHHSLVCTTRWGPLVVTGDAVMTRDFFAHEEGYHNSVDFAVASETIRRIKSLASLVIPGHDSLILNLP